MAHRILRLKQKPKTVNNSHDGFPSKRSMQIIFNSRFVKLFLPASPCCKNMLICTVIKLHTHQAIWYIQNVFFLSAVFHYLSRVVGNGEKIIKDRGNPREKG